MTVTAADALTATTVVPRGDIDLATVPFLREELDRVACPGRRVVLDLSEVDFIDVCGMRLVLEYVHRTQAGELDVSVDLGGPRVRRLAELLGLTALFGARRL